MHAGEANVDLRNACLNNEAFLSQQLRVARTTAERRLTIADTIVEEARSLRNLENGTTFESEPYQPARLYKETRLLVPLTELYSTKGEANLGPSVDLWRRMEGMTATLPSTMAACMDGSIAKVQRMVQELRRTQLQLPASLHGSPNAALDALQALAVLPVQAEGVQAVDTSLAHMEAQLTNIHERTQGKKQLTELEVEEAEQQLTLRAALIDGIWEKLGLIDAHERRVTPFAAMTDILSKAQRELQPLMDDKTRLHSKVEEDLRVIGDDIARAHFGNEQAEVRFRVAKERSDKALKDNEKSQEECWKTIQELESKLQTLGEQRYEEVERRVELTSNEEKRKAAQRQYIRALVDHRRLLENTALNCTVALECCANLEALVDELVTNLKYHTTTRLEAIEEQRLDAQKTCLRYFTLHCRLTPILIDFNELNLEKIYRSMAESYKFTYLYRERRSENEKDLAALLAEQREEYERFKPIMDALIAAGVEFVNPVEEVGLPSAEVSERRFQLMQYRKAFSQMGEEDIDEMKAIMEDEYVRSGGTTFSKEDTQRGSELYFNLRSPLATPRQLHSGGRGVGDREVSGGSLRYTRPESAPPELSAAFVSSSATPERRMVGSPILALARPASPLDGRLGSPTRAVDHPVVGRRSVLASRPIEDKRPGEAAIRAANDLTRKELGLPSG